MTLVVAGKYMDGILVMYDMLQRAILEGGKVLVNRFVDKVIPIWNGQGFVGIAGHFEGDLEDLMQRIEGAPIEGGADSIKEILAEKTAGVSYGPKLSPRFILGSVNGSTRLMLHTPGFGTKEVDYCGIGLGYYSVVEEMIDENHSPNHPLSCITALFDRAMGLARIINQSQREGIPLVGIGMAKLTRGGYEVIERRKS